MNPSSFLYVPGHRPELLHKALSRGADALVIDLEDAVPEDEKKAARKLTALWLARQEIGSEIWVRVNNRPDLFGPDVEAVIDHVTGICIPKVESVDILGSVHAPVMALIESGVGWLAPREIAAHPSVVRLACGEVDLAADLGVVPSEDEREWLPFRMQVVAVSAAERIQAPLGPASTDLRDLPRFRKSTEALMRMGFSARPAIHPSQIGPINEVFTPSPEEVAAAAELIEHFDAAGGGAFVDNTGRMVDEAVIRSARRTMERSASLREARTGPVTGSAGNEDVSR